MGSAALIICRTQERSSFGFAARERYRRVARAKPKLGACMCVPLYLLMASSHTVGCFKNAKGDR
jgi:hypothetical protein